MQTKKIITHQFRMAGYILDPPSIKYLTQFSQQTDPKSFRVYLKKIIAQLGLRIESPNITVSAIKDAMFQLTTASSNQSDKDIVILSCTEFPKFRWDPKIHRFQKVESFSAIENAKKSSNAPQFQHISNSRPPSPIPLSFDRIPTPSFGSLKKPTSEPIPELQPTQLTVAWIDHFNLILQKTLSHPKFMMESLDATSGDFIVLTTVISAINSSGNRWILGLLTSSEPGKYFICDPTGRLSLDFSSLQVRGGGFFLESSFVIVQGHLTSPDDDNPIFQATQIALPPILTKYIARAKLGTSDWFGAETQSTFKVLRRAPNTSSLLMKTLTGSSTTTTTTKSNIPPSLTELKDSVSKFQMNRFIDLQSILKQRNKEKSKILFISQPCLDQLYNVSRFEMVLSGYANSPPEIFYILGDLAANQKSHIDLKSFSRALDNFVHCCEKFPTICESTHFIFVPGPFDPLHSNIVPKPPYPKKFFQHIAKVLKKFTLVSNPTRLGYYGQEITVFRQDLIHDMPKTSLVPPFKNKPSEYPHHCAFTILSQSHLYPMSPRYFRRRWNLNSSLFLHPNPDVLILSDKIAEYYFYQGDCLIVNVPPFYFNNTFCVYDPYHFKVKFLQLKD